jgi:uncharacterized membrane protein YecN with MAPEG domain
MPFALKLTAFYAAINALIMLVLALRVTLLRRKTHTLFLDGGHSDLTRAMRAHGNNTEYVPIALILMGLTQIMGGTDLAIHMIGLPLTLGRLIHPYGLMRGAMPARGLGMVLTWFAVAAGIVIVLTRALAAPN